MSSRTRDLLNQAEALFAAHALAEATLCFERAREEEQRTGSPSSRPALGLARVRVATGDHAAARVLLDRLIADFPREAEPLAVLGVVEELLGHLPAAITLYRRATEADPDAAVAHYNLGRALGRCRRWPEAAAALARAAELDPGHVGYLYALGTVLYGGGRTAEAVEALGRCVRLDPDFLDGYVTLADVLVSANHLALADRLLQAAIWRFPRQGLLPSKRAAIACLRDEAGAGPAGPA